MCGLQQVYIFYINHLLKITDLEKSFVLYIILRITATRLLFIWISLYMSTVHIKQLYCNPLCMEIGHQIH